MSLNSSSKRDIKHSRSKLIVIILKITLGRYGVILGGGATYNTGLFET